MPQQSLVSFADSQKLQTNLFLIDGGKSGKNKFFDQSNLIEQSLNDNKSAKLNQALNKLQIIGIEATINGLSSESLDFHNFHTIANYLWYKISDHNIQLCAEKRGKKAGRLLFRLNNSEIAVVKYNIEKHLPDLSTLNILTKHSFSDWVLKCLNKKRVIRLQESRELNLELQHQLGTFGLVFQDGDYYRLSTLLNGVCPLEIIVGNYVKIQSGGHSSWQDMIHSNLMKGYQSYTPIDLSLETYGEILVELSKAYKKLPAETLTLIQLLQDNYSGKNRYSRKELKHRLRLIIQNLDDYWCQQILLILSAEPSTYLDLNDRKFTPLLNPNLNQKKMRNLHLV